MDPNPRTPKIDRSIWKEIREHLLNHEGTPNTFHLKNKGITLIAADVEKLSDDYYRVVCQPGQGIVDGGHTYKLIQENMNEIGEAVKANDDSPLQQFVKVEVLTGISSDISTEIAGGLNTAIQVQTYSLENLKGEFKWIKEILDSQLYGNLIAYRENESKSFDVRDVLLFLDLFNISAFPNENGDHPTRAYNTKSTVLDYYIEHSDEYKALGRLLPDILVLHDTIAIEARDLHNKAGGKGGKLAFVEQRQRGEFDFPFIGKKSKYRLHRGALFPMLASFRWLIQTNGKTGNLEWRGGFRNVLKLWQKVGGEMMRATQSTSDDYGRKVAMIGKSKNHWANLHNIVAKNHLLMERK